MKSFWVLGQLDHWYGPQGTVAIICTLYQKTDKTGDMREKPAIHQREPHKTILLLTREKIVKLMNTPLPPEWQRWSYRQALAVQIDGPLWGPRKWFGPQTTPADAKRCQRAILELEEAGLVEVTARIRNIRVTTAGWELVTKILAEERARRKLWRHRSHEIALIEMKRHPQVPPKPQP